MGGTLDRVIPCGFFIGLGIIFYPVNPDIGLGFILIGSLLVVLTISIYLRQRRAEAARRERVERSPWLKSGDGTEDRP